MESPIKLYERGKKERQKKWAIEDAGSNDALAKATVKHKRDRQLTLNEDGEITYITNSGKRKVLKPYDPADWFMADLKKSFESFENDENTKSAERILRSALQRRVRNHIYGLK